MDTLRDSLKRARHVFIVSDATGATCETVVKAALSQFANVDVQLRLFSHVLSDEQIDEVMQQAAAVHGVVVYTMVSVELREKILQAGLRTAVPTVDILGPILTRLSDQLELSPMAQPGLFRHLDRAYYKRLEAVDYTVKHDDGLGMNTLHEAEIVLVGVSRTSKTPVSLYLSFRGWKVANIPLVPGIDLPPELERVDSNRIVGFLMQPEQLRTIRLKRQTHLGGARLGKYADLDAIEDERRYSRRLFAQRGWPMLDVTAKAIEETSSEVMRIIFSRSGQSKGFASEAGRPNGSDG